MKIVTKEIKIFIDFLNLNWFYIWKHISDLSSKDELEKRDMVNEWLQFNWEIMVEASFNLSGKGLEVYGEGADLHIRSERMRNPNLEPAYFIGVSLLDSNKNIDLLTEEEVDMSTLNLYKFVNFDGHKYSESEVFDHVLLEDVEGVYRLFPINNLQFLLKEY